ncbi:hypothetical protein FK178_04550 [Antarcticibacterium arcticum]|uniref:Lipoprotein n=1 Tax=Antarcticibacterium arcticum TaxID=2585771 RepID=A0A5B8YGB3_9FLAO|nr:hypothetical protein [Antarcticibacterium arcticum]QED37022.1 hypothetical protein FK178_04550 [Antarcticibacterium arcticum]
MKTKVITFTCVILVSILLGCGTTGPIEGESIIRTATNTPERFEIPSGTTWDETCKNPIIDPMDGAELILVESGGGFGNYRPVRLKYGLTRGELLRINCRTGAVVGIVKETKQ